MPIQTDKYGEMGERRKTGAGGGLANRAGEQHGPGHGLAHVNVNEGANQRGKGVQGEAERERWSQKGQEPWQLQVARWCQDVRKVVGCPVLASSVRQEPWWPGRTLPSLRAFPVDSADSFKSHTRVTWLERFPAEFRCGDCDGDTNPVWNAGT